MLECQAMLARNKEAKQTNKKTQWIPEEFIGYIHSKVYCTLNYSGYMHYYSEKKVFPAEKTIVK